MVEFTVHDENSAPAEATALTQAKKQLGFIPNLYGVLAESPQACVSPPRRKYRRIRSGVHRGTAISPISQYSCFAFVYRLGYLAGASKLRHLRDVRFWLFRRRRNRGPRRIHSPRPRRGSPSGDRHDVAQEFHPAARPARRVLRRIHSRRPGRCLGSRHRGRERAGSLPRPASVDGRSTGGRAVAVAHYARASRRAPSLLLLGTDLGTKRGATAEMAWNTA
jgi:hypothetical protein